MVVLGRDENGATEIVDPSGPRLGVRLTVLPE